MKNVAVIGAKGFVGSRCVDLFRRRYDVIEHDKSAPALWEQVQKCELAVIAVPTPSTKDGSCDTSIVEQVIKDLHCPLILCKSTVPPGTTDRLKKEYRKRIVFSPEYMGESKYYTPPKYMHPTDMVQHPFQILGGDKADTSEVIEWLAPIMGPHVFYYQVPAATAEMIKYWENCWGAMKVVFANEMRNVCEAFGVDFWEAREGWGLDNRVEKAHSAAFADSRGFGGKCFPKDLMALVKASEKAGYSPSLLKQILSTNQKVKRS